LREENSVKTSTIIGLAVCVVAAFTGYVLHLMGF